MTRAALAAAAAVTLALAAPMAQAQSTYNVNQMPSDSPTRYVPPGAYPSAGTPPMAPRQPLAAMPMAPTAMPDPVPMPTPAHPFAGLTLPRSQGDVNAAYNGGGAVLEYRSDGTRTQVR
jgi:hypothetical protein